MKIFDLLNKYCLDDAMGKQRMFKSTKNGRVVTEAEAQKISDRQKKFMNKKVWTREDYQKMLDFEFFVPVDLLKNDSAENDANGNSRRSVSRQSKENLK